MAAIGDFLSNLFPEAGPNVTSGGLRMDMPLPARREASVATPPQVSGQVGPGAIKWGLPTPTGGDTGSRTVTVGPQGTGDPLNAWGQAIKNIESGGGNYKSIGPTHPKLGRALGAYQVMEANVGPWTKEALGKELTAEEFLANPQAQDAVFRQKFGQYVKDTGSPQDAASMWFTGKPAAEGAGAKDSLGTSGADYVSRFNAALGGMPGAPDYRSPQLPLPGATVPLKGLPPNAFDAFNQLKVTRPEAMGTGDRITNVLAQMAAGAAGAKNIGDVLAGAGAGAAAGAAENIKGRRSEERAYGEKEDALRKLLAQVSVDKAQAETQGQNYQIAAKNKDNELLNLVKTEQAKLDTATSNKIEEHKNQIAWDKWKMFQPQLVPTKDGLMIVERNEQGGMKATVQKGNEMDALADKMGDFEKIYGKGSEAAEALRYAALTKQGEPYVRRQIVRDMVSKGQVVDVLGPDQAKVLEKEAEKGVDPKLMTDAKAYAAAKQQRMIDLLWGQLQGKDEAWLPKMLEKGNFGARLLAQPGG